MQQDANKLHITFADQLGVRLFETLQNRTENITQSPEGNKEKDQDSWLGGNSDDQSEGSDFSNKEESSINEDEPLWVKLYTKQATRDDLIDAARELAQGLNCKIMMHENGKQLLVKGKTNEDVRGFRDEYQHSDLLKQGIKITKIQTLAQLKEAHENIDKYK